MNAMFDKSDIRSQEISRRRRAIYLALEKVLDKDLALQGTSIWQLEFSDKPVYALQPFISRLYAEFDLDVSRVQMQRSLLNALSADNSQLPPDPLAGAATGKETTPRLEVPQKVFTHFMEYFMAGITQMNPSALLSIKTYMFDQVHKVGISGKTLNNFRQWLSESGQAFLIQNLDLAQMQGIFHIAYVGACEFLGPVNTDKLVAETIRLVEEMPEAATFSPRSFL